MLQQSTDNDSPTPQLWCVYEGKEENPILNEVTDAWKPSDPTPFGFRAFKKVMTPCDYDLKNK